MTMPVEEIVVECPECGHVYEDWIRRSVNLMLDDFDDDYLDQCSSSVCPKCKHKVHHGGMVVGKDGTLQVDNPADA